MKLLVLIAILGIATDSGAQWPWSPAFDSNVYRPQLGKPGEWDTLHVTWAKEVDYVGNLGPGPGQPDGQLGLTGFPSNPPFVTALHTGSDFFLGDLQPVHQLDFVPRGVQPYRGHFRNRSRLDLYAPEEYIPRIYWELEGGGFSKDSSTVLQFGGFRYYIRTNGFHSPLYNDSVEDLVFYGEWRAPGLDGTKDSIFLLLFKGDHLYAERDTAYPDSVFVIERPEGSTRGNWERSYFLQADFRGTGREDAIGYGRGWYYYKNDPPFSLGKFLDGMLFDTIFKPWENPDYNDYRGASTGAVFPKRNSDHSFDLLINFQRKDLLNSIFLYRGGPEFGSHPIHMDSATYIIRNPRYIDPQFGQMTEWNGGLLIGDFTGTGRPVIGAGGRIGASLGLVFFYVLGDATDEKADMFWVDEFGTLRDTVHSYKLPLQSDFHAKPYIQRLELLHGSSRMPVRINPLFSSVRTPIQTERLGIYPNPCNKEIHCGLTVPEPSAVEFKLRNVLGQEEMQWTRTLGYGAQQVDLDISALPSGEYVLECEVHHSKFFSKVTVIR